MDSKRASVHARSSKTILSPLEIGLTRGTFFSLGAKSSSPSEI